MSQIKEDILIENIEDFDPILKKDLANYGFITIGDLIKKKAIEINDLFTDPYSFMLICNVLHYRLRLYFVGEFNEFEPHPEIDNRKVDNLELPNNIKRPLRRNGVETLKDLLTTDYDDFTKMNNLGKKKIKVIKAFVHSLGYALRSERNSIDEKREIYRNKGIRLLEEDFPNPNLYKTFYRYNIYTIDELLRDGSDVIHFIGFGPVRIQELETIMQELNLEFNTPYSFYGEMQDKKEEENKQLKKLNDEINIRLSKKQMLINEYNRLMQENTELLAREQELDELLIKIKDALEYGRI